MALSNSGVISSTKSAESIGIHGKALGGVYSSLSRQRIAGQRLVFPWGKSADGRGLRWKLNDNLIDQKRLAVLIKPLIAAHDEE